MIKIPVNPSSAPKTKRMQAITQAEIDVRPSTFGEFVVMLVKMLIKTRNRVTRRVMRPEVNVIKLFGFITDAGPK